MLEIIHSDHRNINQLLRILRKKIQLLENDEKIDYRLVKAIIDYLRHYMNPTPYMKGEKVVFIGEINEHENRNNRTKAYVQDFVDVIMGVYLAQDIPYIFYWELYSNDTKTGSKRQDKVLNAQDLAGNWLIRPDGSFGWAQEYFNNLLKKVKN